MKINFIIEIALLSACIVFLLVALYALNKGEES